MAESPGRDAVGERIRGALSPSGPYCADVARENNEAVTATASRIDHWFLIEYRGLWSRDALRGSGLSDQVKAHLREQVAAVTHGRLLFIRRPDRRRSPELNAFAACSKSGRERLTRVTFETYEDLRTVDLRTGEPVAHPLFLVCTHGKHDRCCARYGRPLYEALRDELDPDWVWQSTHVGGDRFAGNLVCLPEGLYYGRVDRASAVNVLHAHLARQIALDHYRGRSCYPFAVQAAEHSVREALQLTGIQDLALEGVVAYDGSWKVTFRGGGRTQSVEVVREDGEPTLLTCDRDELKRPRHFVAR